MSRPAEPKIYRAHIREGARITVPAAVRRVLDLQGGDEIEFVGQDGVVELRKASPRP